MTYHYLVESRLHGVSHCYLVVIQASQKLVELLSGYNPGFTTCWGLNYYLVESGIHSLEINYYLVDSRLHGVLYCYLVDFQASQ